MELPFKLHLIELSRQNGTDGENLNCILPTPPVLSLPPSQNPLEEKVRVEGNLASHPMGFKKEARREDTRSMQLRFSHGIVPKVQTTPIWH